MRIVSGFSVAGYLFLVTVRDRFMGFFTIAKLYIRRHTSDVGASTVGKKSMDADIYLSSSRESPRFTL